MAMKYTDNESEMPNNKTAIHSNDGGRQLRLLLVLLHSLFSLAADTAPSSV
jgi:hypothetical protein